MKSRMVILFFHAKQKLILKVAVSRVGRVQSLKNVSFVYLILHSSVAAADVRRSFPLIKLSTT